MGKSEGATIVVVFCAIFTAALVVLVILSGYPTAMIVIGSNNLENCPVQSKIPLFMVVLGSNRLFMYTMLLVLILSIGGIVSMSVSISSGECGLISGCLLGLSIFTAVVCGFLFILSILFNFAWLVTGALWVYPAKFTVNHDSSTNSNYCDKLTYDFAFWGIIASFITGL